MEADFKVAEFEAGLIAAGNCYEDTGNVIQDLDNVWKIEILNAKRFSKDIEDLYFETREGAVSYMEDRR